MKALLLVAFLLVLPIVARAQAMGHPMTIEPEPGLYLSGLGGANWLLLPPSLVAGGATSTGYAVGGGIGYDFVGFRAGLEGVYRNNRVGQLSAMANVLYDFAPGDSLTPYVGLGAGVAIVDGDSALGSTQFAYQGTAGIAWNTDKQIRLSLEGRYFGTTNPAINNRSWGNADIGILAGVHVKFGNWRTSHGYFITEYTPPNSFIVFFDWNSAVVTRQAMGAIKQARSDFARYQKTRISLAGHTDRTGPPGANLALSLRRANAVKDALISQGVPASAIAVVGKGDTQLLVDNAANVREPQNRRVEILLQ